MADNSQLKLLFTGDYLVDYNRIKIIRSGLTKLGHKVVDLPFTKKSSETQKKLAAAGCDLVFLPSFTHQQVSFVKKCLPEKFLIFDPLISRYLTKVHDYKLVSPFGLSALRNFYRDKWSMQTADHVVTDTQAHLEYFHSKFSIPKEKMSVLYIGNNFDDYYPRDNFSRAPQVNTAKANKKFIVGFYGGFIPLQGVMTILESARQLLSYIDIEFQIIGSGFEFEKAKKFVATHSLHNVQLPGWIEFPELRERINEFDIALGIFGTTEKSDLVIPNKVYHYMACARPVITKDSAAIREIFTDKKDLWMIPASNSNSLISQRLTQAILHLKNDEQLCANLAQSAHTKLRESYTETHVANRLVNIYRSKFNRNPLA